MMITDGNEKIDRSWADHIGGVGGSRGVAAALAAGAAGVRMGTRFLAASESGVHPLYREALIAASADDSVMTDEFRSDWPDELSSSRCYGRSFRQRTTSTAIWAGELAIGLSTMPVSRFSTAPPVPGSSGAIEAMARYAGESVRFVRSEESATEIVLRVAEGAKQLLRKPLRAHIA